MDASVLAGRDFRGLDDAHAPRVVRRFSTQIDGLTSVEWDRIALDTVVLGIAMPVSGAVTAAFSAKVATIFKNPETKKLAEAAIREALGLSSDAALQTYWSAMSQNTKMTYEEFLANAFNSFVGRTTPAMAKGAGGLLTRDLAFRFPPYRPGKPRGELEE